MNKPNPVSVRIPRDVKDWLKARAEVNNRTMHGEILALLEATKQTDGTTEKVAA